jgi:hypothetical protein
MGKGLHVGVTCKACGGRAALWVAEFNEGLCAGCYAWMARLALSELMRLPLEAAPMWRARPEVVH